jgi:predicted nucleic acid-binding protein
LTTYVDSSALLKCYIEEHDSELAASLVASDHVRVTSWVTYVEVRRNLARHLAGAPLRATCREFETHFDAMAIVLADETVCRSAAAIGEELGVRSLDAIHLSSAKRLQISGLSFITFDLRQGQAARTLGLHVLGC